MTSESKMNWAANITYAAANQVAPSTVPEIQELVAKSSTVKALGTRHAFNEAADSPGLQISTQNLTTIFEIDSAKGIVSVGAGIKYGDLAEILDAQGFALRNLASLPHISVAGSCATGTHGSGDQNPTLSAAVREMEMVTASGELLTVSGSDLEALTVHLGAAGIVTKMDLEIVPTFQIAQTVYEDLPLQAALTHFDDITAAGYSVSFFGQWRSTDIDQIWVKRRVGDFDPASVPTELYGAKAASEDLHPIRGISAVNCTKQMGIPGPWYDRLPHFRMNFTPSSGEELQSEFLIPRPRALEALEIVASLREKIEPLLQVNEVRMIAADDLWMSPCYHQPCVGVHFTWKKDWEGVRPVLALLNDRFAPLGARPHWAKLFTMSPADFQTQYPKLDNFRSLLAKLDPNRKFANAYLNRNIYA